MRTAKKRIGIITRAVGLNDYFGRCALDAFSTLLDEHFQFEYHNKETGEKLISSRTSAQPAENLTVQSIDAATTIKIAKLLSQDGHDVFIRPHPKENPIVWEKLMQQSNVSSHIADPKLPIATWLSSLDYVVGPPSTSFYDAVMLGVTPISISELDVRRSQFVGQLWEDNNRLMPHIYKPKSLNGLKEYINSDQRLILSPEISQILREEADYPECISSLDKVVKICESLVSYKNNRACSRLQLFLFSHARLLFTMIWKIKNLISSRKENSALFAMDHKNIEFINKLSIQKITYKS